MKKAEENKMSFKIAEIENLAYEKPFGEYATFKNRFLNLMIRGSK